MQAGAIGILVYRRLLALARFQKEMSVINNDDAVLAKELIAAAPEELRMLLTEDLLLQNLLEYGVAERKYSLADSDQFKNKGRMKTAFKKLETAWNGNVQVRLTDDGDRVQVLIRVPRR